MKKFLLSFSVLTLCTLFAKAQVSINNDGSAPHPNAMLEIKAVNKGLLLPRGDADTRNPALKDNTGKGLLLFDTLRGTVWVHDGNGTPLGWKELQDDVSGLWVKNALTLNTNPTLNPNVGIGMTTTTASRLQVNGNASTNPVIKSLVTYTGNSDVRAVEGTSLPATGYGIGGYFEGGFFGLRAVGNPQGTTSSAYGVYSTVANATTASNKYGIYSSATGLGNNYGLYLNSSGGSVNYSLYANDGNAFVSDSLWLGKTIGAAKFDMTGGKGDVDLSEGDFRIGTSTNRLKLGVYTTGTFAGLARIYAAGTNPMLVFGNNGMDILGINPVNNGTVVIGNGTGVTQYANGYKLNVHGKIVCTELMVKSVTSWPDFVFDKSYELMPLSELRSFIQTNKHLPGIPAASEVESSGLQVGEMQKKMMQKIEELTLYILQQQEQLQKQQKQIERLKKKLK